jgi:hypothetical protein
MSLFTNIYTQNSRESMDKILDLKENSKIKENDGGSKFNYDTRTFVNVTMHPYHNNII